MRRHAVIARFAALALLFLFPASVRAQGGLGVDLGAAVWRMRGTLVADQKTANADGATGITLGFTGQADTKTRWLGVVHAEIFGGDSFDAWSYVNNVSHYTPTITIVGPPDLAAKVLGLKTGTRVALEGVLDTRARNLMLDVVKELPAAGASK